MIGRVIPSTNIGNISITLIKQKPKKIKKVMMTLITKVTVVMITMITTIRITVTITEKEKEAIRTTKMTTTQPLK